MALLVLQLVYPPEFVVLPRSGSAVVHARFHLRHVALLDMVWDVKRKARAY